MTRENSFTLAWRENEGKANFQILSFGDCAESIIQVNQFVVGYERCMLVVLRKMKEKDIEKVGALYGILQ